MEPTIEVVDNLFSEDIAQLVSNYCYDASYMYGASDNPFDAPTGLTNHIQILDEQGIDHFDHKNHCHNEERMESASMQSLWVTINKQIYTLEKSVDLQLYM